MAVFSLKAVFKKCLVVAIACSLSLLPVAPVIACGPFYDDAIYSYSLHPDLPLQFFADGKLALVEPTFARSYLFVAYRYLNDKPLSSSEREQVLNLWRFRLGTSTNDDDSASELWLKARNQAVAGKPGMAKIDSIAKYRQAGGEDDYNPYLNCTADAFTQASKTLQAKITKYGAASNEVKEWLTAQDKVFCHCSGPSYDYSKKVTAPAPAFPEPAPASASEEVKQERAYQIAAANFYAKNFDQAAKQFSLIALDTTSPFKKISAYLVARCLIRKATVSSTKSVDQAALQAAKSKLLELQADPALDSLKDAVVSLLKFVGVRLDPAVALTDISKRLVSGTDATCYDDLEGYLYLLDNAFHEDSEESATTHKVDDSALAAAMRADDMSDWIWTFSSDDKQATDHAIERYQKEKNLCWLVCAASKLKGNEAIAPEILGALAAVPKSSPTFVTTAYQQARILSARNAGAEATSVIDNTLKATRAPSATNKLNLLKLNLAKSLDEMLTLSYCSPALIVGEGEGAVLSEQWADDDKKKIVAYKTIAPVLRPEAAMVLNQKLPLSQFLVAAESQRIPKSLRADFAQAAFCRSVLLHDSASASRAGTLLRKSMPTLENSLTNYDQAAADSKDFSAAFMFLKNPGARPYVTAGVARTTPFNHLDDYQDNLWDAIKVDTAVKYPGQNFIKATELAKAKVELALINSQSPAANYLGKVVTDYAKTHKNDPRVPEALHMVVRATKLGATNSGTSAMSKLAFQLLHQNYKGNAWTVKTPYFY